jgi:hypothetical protein
MVKMQMSVLTLQSLLNIIDLIWEKNDQTLEGSNTAFDLVFHQPDSMDLDFTFHGSGIMGRVKSRVSQIKKRINAKLAKAKQSIALYPIRKLVKVLVLFSTDQQKQVCGLLYEQLTLIVCTSKLKASDNIDDPLD